jgi:hypothetical protein
MTPFSRACRTLVLRLALASAFWFSGASAFSSTATHIAFVPPPMEGTISLGIYNSEGKLVRVLHREAAESQFGIGLDGLITEWDGKTDDGKEAPNGKYFARGLVVGDLGVEGVAYHGNDWITDNSSPRIRRIRKICTMPNGWLLMLVENASGGLALVRCDSAGTIVWNQRLPDDFKPVTIAVNERDQFVAEGARVVRFDQISARSESLDVESNVTGLAAEDDVLAVASGTKTRVYEIGSGAIVMSLDSEDPITDIAIRGEMLASLQGGRVYLSEDSKWTRLDQPSLTEAVAISLTPERKIWVIDRGPDGVEVKQFSSDGEFERRLKTATDAPTPVQISVSSDEREVYLLEENETTQRVRCLALVSTEPAEGNDTDVEATSVWEESIVRSIEISDSAEGRKLKTADGRPFTPADWINVKLRPNPLERDASETVEVGIACGERGSQIVLKDGLPLCHVTETPSLRWAVLGRDPDGEEIRIFQSDGSVIEEFVANRMANMMTFDAGEFYLGPAPDEDMPSTAPGPTPEIKSHREIAPADE